MAEINFKNALKMKRKKIILQVQGGMGNQIIQYGYIQSLVSNDRDLDVEVNPIMVSRMWAKLRGVSYRPLSKLILNHFPIIESKRDQTMDWINSKIHSLNRLRSKKYENYHEKDSISTHYNGYFQNRHAFEVGSDPLWQTVLSNLKILKPNECNLYPRGQIAIHHRLGDYLWSENKNLFAPLSIKEQVNEAINWRSENNSSQKINIFTDSTELLREIMENQLTAGEQEECNLTESKSAIDDFNELSRHRHIVASCSTFALCAGKIAWQRLVQERRNRPTATLQLPRSWYQNEKMNQTMIKELDHCSFTRKKSVQKN